MRSVAYAIRYCLIRLVFLFIFYFLFLPWFLVSVRRDDYSPEPVTEQEKRKKKKKYTPITDS